MRVVLADPPAFTPPYDHELAAALARAGAEVELVTSRFRFGETVEPDGYERRELFYPISSRLFGRSRLRLPLKVAEHPLGLARLALRPADVVHFQWLAAPELDARLLRARAPLVFTAHDLLPRRTASKTALWQRLFGRFERIVVHSARGRETLAETWQWPGHTADRWGRKLECRRHGHIWDNRLLITDDGRYVESLCRRCGRVTRTKQRDRHPSLPN